MNAEETLARRKERRFRTSDGQVLECETVVNEESNEGAVIDISATGLRLLCEGKFSVGQTFSTELKADGTHGTYRGVIRRVEPWVGGQSILGCQLIDAIPEDVLELLAHQGIVNRRRDDRVDWNQPAKMSWELHQGEVDIEIQDCSPGGLKVYTQKPIPDDLRLRILVDMGDEEPMIVDAKSVWQRQQKEGSTAGLAFTNRGVPEAIARILAGDESDEKKNGLFRSSLRRSVLVAATIAVIGLALWQTGVWG